MTIADSVWLATALLHRQNPQASDFSVHEIIERSLATRGEGYRPGVPVFTSKHCVANKTPNPLRYRMLVETTRGRRRLFRTGDPFHPDRQDGKIRPEKVALPAEYQPLVDWYETEYSKGHQPRSERQTEGPAMYSTPIEPKPGVVFVSSGGAVIIPENVRKDLGIEEGTRLSVRRDKDRIVLQPVNEESITRLRGSCKGGDSLVEAREREHRDEQY